ncbi:metallophosphoesterase [Archangium violaceum]|uniref:metallophosphoesterase n=1 Tax=Archangium violaceum TaxID=83451 RepID=UPI00194FAA87|nr:metallophosphoesterase [Archangium violaceum]QRN99524.1 metallophosphoesterase [Archangium violaceum]
MEFLMKIGLPAPDSEVFVISDLHVGGQPVEGERGFRLMTEPGRLASFIRHVAARSGPVELVINGDFIDFLAERHEQVPHWRAWNQDEQTALDLLERMTSREPDADVFKALAEFVAAGHSLTVLLGNHDIELSYPRVRQALLSKLGPFDFVYDNEALVRGDAVIEHGNRYDRFNQVDHDGLRRLRSAMSRRDEDLSRAAFSAPPGSRMVADVMNPMKEQFAFVDLLKPETGAVIPTLLALDPSSKGKLRGIIESLAPSISRGIDSTGQVKFAGDMSAPARGTGPALDMGMGASGWASPAGSPHGESVLGERGTREFSQSLFAGDIGAGDRLAWFSSLASLFARSGPTLEQRLPVLLRALRTLASDQSFSRDVETEAPYMTAVTRLLGSGFRYVVFGHTHLPKHIRLDGGEYLNSGTWADRIRLPEAIFHSDEQRALSALREFVEDLQFGRLGKWIFREYTYVKLQLESRWGRARVAAATLETWPSAPNAG